MIKRESKSSILFRHWVMANPQITKTCTFEMKDTRGKDYLRYAEVKTHQIDYGRAIMESEKGVLIRVQGTNGEPDYVFLKKEPAFIVIKYPDCFCIVGVYEFWKQSTSGSGASLPSARARKIAYEVIEL